jgi:hypothetical protein
MLTKDETVAAVLESLGLTSDPGYTVNNAVTSAYDAGVPLNEILAAAQIASGSTSKFTTTVSNLTTLQQQSGFPDARALVSNLETAVGLPAGVTGASSTGSSDVQMPGTNASISDAIAALMTIGYSQEDALDFLRNDTNAALALIKASGINLPGGDGGGGGSGRFLFPEEQEALRLQNQHLSRLLAGNLGFQEVRPGIFYDPISGQLINEAELDLTRQRVGYEGQQIDINKARQALDEARFEFESGPQFAEQRRQFGEQMSLARDQLGLDQSRLVVDEDISRQTLATQGEGMRRSARLAEQQEAARILSSPADFLARAFATRGEEFGGTKMTQADLLNALRGGIDTEITRSQPSPNMAQNLFGQYMGQYQPPSTTAAPPPTRLPAPAAQPETWDFGAASPLGPFTPETAAAGMAASQANAAQGIASFSDAAGAQWTHNPDTQQWTKLEKGGRVRGAAIVGDSSDGKENREVVISDNAVVIPEDKLKETLGSRLPELQNGGTIGYAGAAPAYGSGGMTTQDELIRLARLYSPPAVNNLLSGQGEMTRPLDTGQMLASPRQFMRLTEDEGKAMGTRLAAEGSSMQDYTSQINQTFGPQRSVRRGRLVV